MRRQYRAREIVRVFAILVFCCSLLVFVSCAGKKKRDVSESDLGVGKPDYYMHTVSYAGETLGLISDWYTGKVSNWQRILSENPGLRPERMNLGDVIRIPKSLLITQEPLPEKKVRSAKARRKKDPGPSLVAPSEVTPTTPPPSEPPPASDEDTTKEDLLKELEAAVDDTEDTQETEEKVEEPKSEPKSEPQTETTGKSSSTPEPEEPPAEEETSEANTDDLERERLLDELLGQ